MLSPDDNSGIVYFLVGIIVIVLAAVGLSLVVDQRFRFSSGVGTLKRELAVQTEEISELTLRRDLLSSTLEGESAKRRPSLGGRQEAMATVAALTARKSELRKLESSLREEISKLTETFTSYRGNYREKTRAKAIGQEIGNLSIRGGREYHQVTITQVTDVGLEIRHEHGIARIQAPDLDPEWQDRFQWSDEERRARLKKESDDLDDIPAVTDSNPPEVPDRSVAGARVDPTKLIPAGSADDPAQLEKIKLLRTQIIGWKSKIGRLEIERSEAASNASYSRQTSVPGSLETWDARAVRLARELTRAQTELTAARARLAALSPGDPSLRSIPGENR